MLYQKIVINHKENKDMDYLEIERANFYPDLINFLKKLKDAYDDTGLSDETLLSNFPFNFFSEEEDVSMIYNSLRDMINQKNKKKESKMYTIIMKKFG